MRIRNKTIVDILYWLLLAITAANYSFFTYNWQGENIEYGVFRILAYARLPISLVGVLLLYTLHRGANTRQYQLIYVLMIAAIITSVWSPRPATAAIYGIWFIFQLLFIVKYCHYLIDTTGYQKAATKLLFPIMLVGIYFILLALAGLPNYVLGQPIVPVLTESRQVVTFAPLFLGTLAICHQSLRQRPLVAKLFIALAIASLLIIIFSGKRAAIICMIVILAANFLVVVRPSKRWLMIAFAPLVVVTLFMVGFQETIIEASEFTLHRFQKGMDYETATSINQRLYIWGLISDLIDEQPLGIGLAVTSELLGVGPHSTYLGYLVETGWIGFLCFSLLIIVSLQRSFFSKNRFKIWVALLITIPCLIFSLTEYISTPGQPLFIPLWVGLIFGLVRQSKPRLSRFGVSSNAHPQRVTRPAGF